MANLKAKWRKDAWRGNGPLQVPPFDKSKLDDVILCGVAAEYAAQGIPVDGNDDFHSVADTALRMQAVFSNLRVKKI